MLKTELCHVKIPNAFDYFENITRKQKINVICTVQCCGGNSVWFRILDLFDNVQKEDCPTFIEMRSVILVLKNKL